MAQKQWLVDGGGEPKHEQVTHVLRDAHFYFFFILQDFTLTSPLWRIVFWAAKALRKPHMSG